MGQNCAYLNNAHLVVFPDGVTPTDIGVYNQCLCYDQLPSFITADATAIAAVNLVGETDTTSALQSLISAAADGADCNYPAHAVSNCRRGNLCRFQCVDGYSPHPFIGPYECVCRAPRVECGGICALQSSCPSNSLKKRKRRLAADGEEEILEYKWWEGAKCEHDFTPCGIFGGSSTGWDCVDTANDLESCGGCSIPLHEGSPRGKDCTSIRGVDDVSCFAGQCQVEKCKKGFKVSKDGLSCDAL